MLTGEVKVIVVFMWLLLCLFSEQNVYALPSAGSEINNRAEASYIPNGYTSNEVIYSNTVQATVQAVEALTLVHDRAIKSVPGAMVSLPHVLTNTGNITSIYIFSLDNTTGDDYDMAGLRLVLDINSNGLFDYNEPIIPLNSPGSAALAGGIPLNSSGNVTLTAGEFTNLLIVGQVPATQAEGLARVVVRVRTVSGFASASNTDTISVTNSAVLSISKSVNTNTQVKLGQTVTYTLNSTNIGNKPALPSATVAPSATAIKVNGVSQALILIHDTIPAGTRFAGNLSASHASAIKLYRLHGAAAYDYKTTYADVSIVDEVAIGLSEPIATSASESMSFNVSVTGTNAASHNSVSTIYNTGFIAFNDSLDNNTIESNQVVLSILPPTPVIGIAKHAKAAVAENDDTGLPDGTYSIPFVFTVKNYGNTPLYNVQITDLFEKNFGRYVTSGSTLNKGQYTIEQPMVIETLAGAVEAQGNTQFSAQTSKEKMLVSGAYLPVGGVFQVKFTVRLFPNDNVIQVSNRATVMASSDNSNTVDASDDSNDNANNPDPDQNNDPSEQSPTLVPLPIPSSDISVTKTVERHQLSLDSYDLDYSIQVKNTGKVEAKAVKVMDNLSCTFNMDSSNSSSAKVKSWSIVKAPAMSKQLLSVNSAYTGKVNNSNFCDRSLPVGTEALLAMSKKELLAARDKFPSQNTLNLTDGAHSLKPNETETISFTVRVVSNSTASDNVITNTAFASSSKAVAVAETTPPTPVPVQKPDIEVVKTVERRGPFGINKDRYELDYTIKVTNKTTVDANFVTVIDNLDCTFKMDTANRLVKSWQLLSEPVIKHEGDSNMIWLKSAGKNYKGYIKHNADGTGICDRKLVNMSSEEAKQELEKPGQFPTDENLNLVDGEHYLKSGQKVTITFTVQTDINPDFVGEETFINNVFVGTFYYNNSAGAGDGQNSNNTNKLEQFNGNQQSLASTAAAAAAAAAVATTPIVDSVPDKGQLFLTKTASKTVAELVDFVDYTLTLTNQTKTAITGYTIDDTLPLGFAYESGSSLVDGVRASNPTGGRGRVLQWSDANKNIPVAGKLVLTYRTRVGVGATQGDGINRAVASSYDKQFRTLEATARVQVTGGVFNDEGFIVGKIYTDCNGDRIQGHEEIGVPGVRVYLEDGTYAISDVEGKYSFYAVKAVTHVLKVDNTSLPQGAVLIPLSNRNSGAGDSQFVDMKKGELHKADFAIHVGNGRNEKLNCDNSPIIAEVQRRRAALVDQPSAEVEYVLRTRLDPSGNITQLGDTRSLPSSGIIGQLNNTANAGVQQVITGSVASAIQQQAGTSTPSAQSFAPVMPPNLSVMRPLALPEKAISVVPKVQLEEQIIKLDNTLDFIDLKDKDTLPIAQANIRVKGMLGVTFRLTVNGIVVSERRIGKRSKLADKQMEAWEFIGVEFRAGNNSVKVEQLDLAGNVRGEKSINVIAPDLLGKLELDLPAVAVADGNTPVQMKLRLTDNNGVPVTARTQVTLESDRGRWITEDLNKTEPGVQLFVEGGSADIALMPPSQPCDGSIIISTGLISREVKIGFLPELRPLIGSGILEGILDLRRLANGSLTKARPKDAFEKELSNFASSSDNGKLRTSGRAAFFFKGSIQGKYLLTTAYDSDKNTHERLFRDIRPDQYYPIYGDSATKGFDAQSSSRLYVRVDKDKSYLLYGDYTTAGNTDVRQITQYNRSLTGIKGHYEDERFNVTGFYSRSSSIQVVEELPANGTSGPYTLNQISNNYLENSERVEIIVRDRNQSSVILASTVQARFSDYNIDPLSKRLLFRGPVPSMDENLNPQYIRVTYETGTNGIGGVGGGPKFGIAGVDAQVKVIDTVQLGVIGIDDENPANKAQMGGVTAVVKLGDNTVINGEFAHTETDLKGSANAERVEIRHDGETLKARAQYTNTEARFSNQSSFSTPGRTEIPATAEYRLTPNTKLKGEAIYSTDNVNGGDRKGIVGNVITRIADGVDLELGMRASVTNGTIGSNSCVSYLSSITNNCTPTSESKIGQQIRNELLTVRGKITTQVPWVDGLQAYVEAEQDVRDSQKRLLALGSNYQLNEKTRLYGRYQLASTLGSQFNLNSYAPNNVGLIGIESAYMKGGNLYNEYRLRDGQSGREASTALGLRNTWLLDEGLRLGAGFESTRTFNGIAGNNSNALVGTLEYFKNPRYRTSASLELRKSDTSDSLLNTLALSYKIDKDWSFLGRNLFSIMDNQGSGVVLQTRQQLGLAYREVDANVWNFLGRYEHKYESGILSSGVMGGTLGSAVDTETDTHIVSGHINYQANADVILSGRYAAKVADTRYLGLSSLYWAQLIYGRATWDFLPDWDASLQAGGYLGKGGTTQYALGAEIGYQVVHNLWLSVGYNVSGISDTDLTSNAYLDSGVYVRGRFKFDENTLSFFQ